MDFFQCANSVTVCYLLPYSRTTFNCTSKTTGWFKRAEMINLHANSVTQVAHAFLYTLMDRQFAVYLTFFHIPERSIALVKRPPKGLKLINLPTLTKCYSKVARVLTLMDFFQSHQTVPKPLLSYLLPYSPFNCTSKTTGWFKRLKLIPTCYANKVLLQGSTRILIYMDGLLVA
jgi:hypothetical protein